MKYLVFILLFCSFAVSAQTTYFVSSGGFGNGLSSASPFSLSQGISAATCGDIVFIQAGDYGSGQYTFSYNCSSGSPIRFYAVDSNWNVIQPPTQNSKYDSRVVERATFTGSESIVTGVIPYLNTGLSAGSNGSGVGVTISGSYIEFSGFAVRGYDKGFVINGSNHTIENINADFNGKHSSDNSYGFLSSNCCSGIGIAINASNSSFKNIFERDGSHIGISNGNVNNTFENIEQYTSDLDSPQANTTDYQILNVADGGSWTEVTIRREIGTVHLSHGFVLKPQSGTAYNVNLNRFYLENTKLELQGFGAGFGTFKNGLIASTAANATEESNEYYATSILILNGSHDNVIENVVVYKPTWTILFEEFDEGYSNDRQYSGADNTFINVIGIDPFSAHFGFQDRQNSANSVATNQNFYHCTFLDGNLTYNNQMNGGMTGGVYNSIITATSIGSGSARLSSSFVFDHINTGLNLAAYTDNAITNNAFSFTDSYTSGDTWADFNYAPTTTILDIGANRTANAPTDIYGNQRINPFTLGATSFGSSFNGEVIVPSIPVVGRTSTQTILFTTF